MAKRLSDGGGGGGRAKSIHQIGLMAISSPPRSTQIVCVDLLEKVSDSMCYDFITMIVKLNSLSP
jgi:hypothetical protein